eukprot:5438481-Prymnesium_polylepis.2
MPRKTRTRRASKASATSPSRFGLVAAKAARQRPLHERRRPRHSVRCSPPNCPRRSQCLPPTSSKPSTLCREEANLLLMNSHSLSVFPRRDVSYRYGSSSSMGLPVESTTNRSAKLPSLSVGGHGCGSESRIWITVSKLKPVSTSTRFSTSLGCRMIAQLRKGLRTWAASAESGAQSWRRACVAL